MNRPRPSRYVVRITDFVIPMVLCVVQETNGRKYFELLPISHLNMLPPRERARLAKTAGIPWPARARKTRRA